PEEETVNGAKGEPALLGRRASAFQVVKEPANLACGKIRIEHQSRFFGNYALVTVLPKGVAALGGAPILPYDRIVNRFAAFAVPNHHGFTLVGDTDTANIAGRDFCLAHDRPDGFEDGSPDFLGVVLDFPRSRINLTQLFLCGGKRPQS